MEMKDTRSGFGAGLTELGKINSNVVALCADLTGSLKMNEFQANHPKRFGLPAVGAISESRSTGSSKLVETI